MIARTVEGSLTDLFLVFGKPSEDRLKQYLVVLRDRTTCTACLLEALDEARVGFDRMPAPKGIVALYQSHHSRHIPHLPMAEEPPYEGPIGAEYSPVDDDIRAELAAGMWDGPRL